MTWCTKPRISTGCATEYRVPTFVSNSRRLDVKRDGKEKKASSQGNESKIGRNDINKVVSSGKEVNSEVPAISAETQPNDDDDDDDEL